jgi:predicted enzyme related to lactoylglutathione lyase
MRKDIVTKSECIPHSNSIKVERDLRARCQELASCPEVTIHQLVRNLHFAKHLKPNIDMGMNTLCWTDIPVANLDRAIKFYSAVLGQEVSKMSEGGFEYGLLPHEEQNASGCLCVGVDSAGSENKPSQNGPLIYLSVEGRLDDAVKAVETSGGKILQAKQQIGPHGFRAVIVDSEGNRLALHSSTA